MAFKFPFTNYHELNLTWVLEQLKKLFEESNENVETIESYENRLSAVETELPVVEATADQAAQTANAAATLAQTAKNTADTANENALAASAQAGLARQEAADAESEAQAATQAAQQVQAIVQDFDGRITQAEDDASEALQEAQSFENRVNAAINTANNAANTATIAQGIAVNANQNAATALDTAQTADGKAEAAQDAADIADGKAEAAQDTADQNAAKIGNLADLTTTAKNNLVAAINEAAQTGGGTDDTKAPLIVSEASGTIASFSDGADNMKIQELICTIEPVQAGTGDPSPTNVRPISGRNVMTVNRTGNNMLNVNSWEIDPQISSYMYIEEDNIIISNAGYFENYNRYYLKPGSVKYFSAHVKTLAINQNGLVKLRYYRADGTYSQLLTVYLNSVGYEQDVSGVIPADAVYICFAEWAYGGSAEFSKLQIVLGSSAVSFEPFTGSAISVSFERMIYGGNAEVIEGSLVSAMDSVDMSSLNWRRGNRNTDDTGYIFYLYMAQMKNIGAVLSSILKTVSISNYGTWERMPVNTCMAANGKYLIICIDYDTVEGMKAGTAGQQIVFEIDTPVEYTITPHEITTLYGVNNVWTDAGSIQSCKYPADTKLYIDGKVAELQALILEN